jgi:DNA-binding GntR family transcriptional regulator
MNRLTPMSETSALRPDRSVPLARQLYDILFERICRFELEPFRMLSEASLSESLGVSRTPAREALARLAEQGLVDVLPQRGTRVAPLRLSDLEKSQFMREALELAILRRAMERPDRAAMVAQLRDEITLQRAFLQVRDKGQFYASDEAFHRHIAVFAGCGPVIADIARFKIHMDRFRHLMVSGVEDLAVVVDQHDEIATVIEAGDMARAETVMRTHLRRIFAFLDQAKAKFPQYFEGSAP